MFLHEHEAHALSWYRGQDQDYQTCLCLINRPRGYLARLRLILVDQADLVKELLTGLQRMYYHRETKRSRTKFPTVKNPNDRQRRSQDKPSDRYFGLMLRQQARYCPVIEVLYYRELPSSLSPPMEKAAQKAALKASQDGWMQSMGTWKNGTLGPVYRRAYFITPNLPICSHLQSKGLHESTLAHSVRGPLGRD